MELTLWRWVKKLDTLLPQHYHWHIQSTIYRKVYALPRHRGYMLQELFSVQFFEGVLGMNLNEMKNYDKKIEPDSVYKLTHYGVFIYLGVVALLLIIFCVLMSIDEKRFLPIGIVLLVLIVLATIALLVINKIVRGKALEAPPQKDEAEHPARISFDLKKYQRFRSISAPDFLGKGRLDAYRHFFADQLMNSELHPAKIVSLSPFIIAVYSKRFDAAVLLLYPERLAEVNHLALGDRLVSTAAYFVTPFNEQGDGKDFFRGPNATDDGKYTDLLPVIPAFLCADTALLKEKENEIAPALWERAETVITKFHEDFPDLYREGLWFIHLGTPDNLRNPMVEAER